MKLGRNERCPCGSGKKFKLCHFPVDPRVRTAVVRPAPELPIQFMGKFLGKPLYVRPDAPAATRAQLRHHLSQFNLAWLLRSFGAYNGSLATEPRGRVNGVLVSQHALAYLALASVESASDDAEGAPDTKDIAQAVQLFDGLPEMTPEGEETDGVLEYLLRKAYAEFAGNDDLHNMIARTWYLYELLWPRVDKAASIDVAAAIRAETGLNLRQLMLFGLTYSVRSKNGFWEPYSREGIQMLPQDLGIGDAEHESFLRMVTATYAEIRELAERAIRGKDFEQYVLSPFLLKPVVRPDHSPAAGAEEVRLVPVPRYLALRVTQGLYHMLSSANDRGGKANPFRAAFGHVFEAYVGELLRVGSGGAYVLSERRYGLKGRKMSPDWLVLMGTKLLVVEVKQSAVTLGTKMGGALRAISEDLRRTLIKGAEQLTMFREDVLAKDAGLEDLEAVTEIQLLLVTHDELAWANWLLRDAIAKEIAGAQSIHLCSIGDLENLQRYCWGASPFDLLAGKLRGPASSYDFREWLSEFGKPPGPHPKLAEVYKELAKSWGAGLLTSAQQPAVGGTASQNTSP
jgi:hypothetical protein